MTQRSILSGLNPNVIIKVGVDVVVRGVEGDQVSVESRDAWGLKVERKKDAIEINLGGSGDVLVPVQSSVKVYSGRNIQVEGTSGDVTAYSGMNLSLRQVGRLVHASAGGAIEIDCQAVVGKEVKLSAGRDIRVYIRDLPGAQIRVNDLGGYWEGRIGDGQTRLVLKAGGDVTLVTDQEVVGQPPDFILGKIEKPG